MGGLEGGGGRNYRVAEASRYLHPAALPMQPRRRVLLGLLGFARGVEGCGC